jgi:hypothetical protein
MESGKAEFDGEHVSQFQTEDLVNGFGPLA